MQVSPVLCRGQEQKGESQDGVPPPLLGRLELRSEDVVMRKIVLWRQLTKMKKV